MTSLFTLLRLPFVRLLRTRYGNVALMWAVSAPVVLALVGVSIDFTRANSARQAMQNAADGAVLVAERMADRPYSERRAAAEGYFRASLAGQDLSAQATISIEELSGGGHRAVASMPVKTTLSRLITNRDFNVNVDSEANQEGSDLEIALILDITGSMAGQRIADLRVAAADAVDILIRPSQAPYYSKVALVPYSNAVNLGSYAGQVRGPITGASTITGATWKNGPVKTITGATRANPVVITSNGHGFANGDFIRITGVNGMTQLNNKIFTVANKTSNTFQLSGVNGSSYSNYSSAGSIQKCFTLTCEVQVTAVNHGLATNDYAFISGVIGMTQINNAANTAWQVTMQTANTFILKTTTGPTYVDYTNGGRSYCTVAGCEYYRFSNASSPSAIRVFRVNTCATERTGADAFKDTAPSTTYLGRNYPTPATPCPTVTIEPLTNDKAVLTAKINALTAAGSTSGHIGIAWGWYMLSPKFGYLWPTSARPTPYGGPHLRKIAIMMTDGAYNTPYCNGVIASNAGSGSGSVSDHINCVAPNGDSFQQSAAICTAMKNAGISVYTVGFDLGSDVQARAALTSCASTPAQALFPSSGAELRTTFRDIATAISQLRLSR